MIRAEWATEELPKQPMAAYVWVYFKLKYTGYIFDGIYFFRYILSGMFCPDMFCPVCFVREYFVWVYFV